MVQEVVAAYLTSRLPDETFREFVGRTPPMESEPRQSLARAGDSGGLP
jgi:hypothetical protein